MEIVPPAVPMVFETRTACLKLFFHHRACSWVVGALAASTTTPVPCPEPSLAAATSIGTVGPVRDGSAHETRTNAPSAERSERKKEGLNIGSRWGWGCGNGRPP